MSEAAEHDAIIVGGGFYGLRVSLYLREELGFKSVLLLEKEPEMMTRASANNQARIHGGYHYPRSILTAYRSRVNFPSFVAEYPTAVVSDFEHIYAIANRLSKVNARQFALFCDRIGAPYTALSAPRMRDFAPTMVDGAFSVQEYAFDTVRLRESLLKRIEADGGIELRVGEEVMSIGRSNGTLEVRTATATYRSKRVISCVYSKINDLHRASGIPEVSLQHEVTEMALVSLPKAQQNTAYTVMDGPFFSLMPYPSRGLFTLSHVRYTPQRRWLDVPGGHHGPVDMVDDPVASRYQNMRADVLRYIPSLGGMKYEGSLIETKTVLTKSSVDDSRPILFRANLGYDGYTCIMGGKLDNIYDVLTELKHLYGG